MHFGIFSIDFSQVLYSYFELRFTEMYVNLTDNVFFFFFLQCGGARAWTFISLLGQKKNVFIKFSQPCPNKEI